MKLILLEGNFGVGKIMLIMVLVRVCGWLLMRINLSD